MSAYRGLLEPSPQRRSTLWHWLAHVLGCYVGTVETGHVLGELMVWFRCSTCGRRTFPEPAKPGITRAPLEARPFGGASERIDFAAVEREEMARERAAIEVIRKREHEFITGKRTQ